MKTNFSIDPFKYYFASLNLNLFVIYRELSAFIHFESTAFQFFFHNLFNIFLVNGHLLSEVFPRRRRILLNLPFEHLASSRNTEYSFFTSIRSVFGLNYWNRLNLKPNVICFFLPFSILTMSHCLKSLAFNAKIVSRSLSNNYHKANKTL